MAGQGVSVMEAPLSLCPVSCSSASHAADHLLRRLDAASLHLSHDVTVHTYGITSNESGIFKVCLRRSAGLLIILLYRPIALQLVQGLGVNNNHMITFAEIVRTRRLTYRK